MNRQPYHTFFPVELLIRIKPKLKEITLASSDLGSLTRGLDQIASLAHSFSEQRIRLGKDVHLADALDQEGA